jgi:hypothetical protein
MLIRSSWVLIAVGALSMAACEGGSTNNPSARNEFIRKPGRGLPGSLTTTTGATIDLLSSAENAALVRQVPDEEDLAPRPTTLINGPANVRDLPAGTQIATVDKSEVTQIAQAHGYYLITFKDSEAPKLMAGWVYKDAFDVPVTEMAGPTVDLTCEQGESRIRTDHQFCVTPCANDRECAGVEGVCDGIGLSVGSNPRNAYYCVTP